MKIFFIIIQLAVVSHVVGAHKISELDVNLKARAFCMTLVNTTQNPFLFRHCLKNESTFIEGGIIAAGSALKTEVAVKDHSCDDSLRLLFITDEDKPRVEVYQGDDDFNTIVFSNFFSEVTLTPVYSQSMPLLKERTVPGLRCVPSTFSASSAVYASLARFSIRYSVNGTGKEVFQTPLVPFSSQLNKLAICIESSITAAEEKDSARKGIESKQERFPVATFYQWAE